MKRNNLLIGLVLTIALCVAVVGCSASTTSTSATPGSAATASGSPIVIAPSAKAPATQIVSSVASGRQVEATSTPTYALTSPAPTAISTSRTSSVTSGTETNLNVAVGSTTAPQPSATPAPTSSATPTNQGAVESSSDFEEAGQSATDKSSDSSTVTSGTLVYGTDYEIVEQGDRDASVTRLQDALTELGYLNGSTGYFGTDTEAAVLAFQRANFLDEDGIVGNSTWDVLMAGNAIAA